MPDAKQRKTRKRKLVGTDGVDYVRCQICGDHRRVISGRHLSKHGIDRETYLLEYRLSPDELIATDVRVRQSSRPDYLPFNRHEWIVGIRRLYRKPGNVSAGQLQKKHRQFYNQAHWIFGDLDTGLHAAGLEPERVRQRNSWDKTKILGRILQLQKQRLPLFANYVGVHHADVFKAARREFGSWPKALFAAGVTKKLRLKRLFRDRLSLLNVLSAALNHSKSEVSQPLKLETEYYFGSFEKALSELRRREKTLPGWNKGKIIKVITQMHRSKQNLSYGAMRRNNMALRSAAEKHFGSWGKALYAAGIDPNIYFVRRRWSKRDHLTTRLPNADNRN